MDGVLRHELESLGDLPNARFDDQLGAASLGMRDEIVQDGESFGAVLLQKAQGLRIAVLDPDLGRNTRSCFGGCDPFGTRSGTSSGMHGSAGRVEEVELIPIRVLAALAPSSR